MGDKITKEQVAQKLQEANTVLVITKKSPTLGYLAAGLAVSGLLRRLNKHAVFVHAEDIPMSIGFLRPDESISRDAETLRNFIISIGKHKVRKFSYNKSEKGYDISLTPAHNEVINAEDLEYSKGDFNVDMILALGVGAEKDISSVISDHEQLVTEIPMVSVLTAHQTINKLNADYWQSEEEVGLGEMIYELSRNLGAGSLDKNISNALMTSIVDFTNHFRNRTLAQTMHIAGDLIERGADLQMIAENLAIQSGNVAEEAVEELVADALAPAEKPESTTVRKNPRRRMSKVKDYVTMEDSKAELAIGKKVVKATSLAAKEHKPEEISIDSSGSVQTQSLEAEESVSATTEEKKEAAPVVAATPASADAGINNSALMSDSSNNPAGSAAAPNPAINAVPPNPISPTTSPIARQTITPLNSQRATLEPSGSLSQPQQPTGQYDNYINAMGNSGGAAPLTANQNPAMAGSSAGVGSPNAMATPISKDKEAMTVNNYLSQQPQPSQAPPAPTGGNNGIPLPAHMSGQQRPAAAVNPGQNANNYVPPQAPPLASMT